MSITFDQIMYLVLGVIALSFIMALSCLILIIKTRGRFKKFMKGAEGRDLEQLMGSHDAAIKDLGEFRKQSIDYFKFLDQRIKKKIGTVETVRFNPFPGSGGGNQSFSSVFVNEEGGGVVISGIYSRERAMVFGKPMHDWKSEFELTSEEKKVIEISRQKNQTKIKNDER